MFKRKKTFLLSLSFGQRRLRSTHEALHRDRNRESCVSRVKARSRESDRQKSQKLNFLLNTTACNQRRIRPFVGNSYCCYIRYKKPNHEHCTDLVDVENTAPELHPPLLRHASALQKAHLSGAASEAGVAAPAEEAEAAHGAEVGHRREQKGISAQRPWRRIEGAAATAAAIVVHFIGIFAGVHHVVHALARLWRDGSSTAAPLCRFCLSRSRSRHALSLSVIRFNTSTLSVLSRSSALSLSISLSSLIVERACSPCLCSRGSTT